MGNTSTKEARPGPRPSSRSGPSSPHGSGPSSFPNHQGRPHNRGDQYSREQFLQSLVGPDGQRVHISGGSDIHDRDSSGLEQRRETKAEREARRLERDRANREIERERSMRDETVDGGYLVTQGTYTGLEDFNKSVVRQLMIERRIAPFWRGLDDHSSSWTENQLVAAAKGLPIPAPDEIPAEEEVKESSSKNQESNTESLAVPRSPRGQFYGVDTQTVTGSSVPNPTAGPGSAILRTRAKTLASLSASPRSLSPSEMSPREIQLPEEPTINGQRVEAYLYKDAAECPICFLYYPPYLNRTRCCDQPICSECFVQIKRPDPHPPEHADPSAPPPNPNEPVDPLDPEGSLVSEPSACPYCQQPEFGVTFEPPPFRRGLSYMGNSTNFSRPTASSSSSVSSLHAGNLTPSTANRRRNTSLSASAPQVITTDRIRPDWATKLATARAHAARRSAAATALHTAAYLMNGRDNSRNVFGPFGGRRPLIMPRGGSGEGPNSAQMQMLALMSERFAAMEAAVAQNNNHRGDRDSTRSNNDGTIEGPPRDSSRRNRIDDLEEMMMMEAIRQSLAVEEDKRRREEKEAKKEAKKKEKENKKLEKQAKKSGASSSGMYSATAAQSQSSSALASSSIPFGRHDGSSSFEESSSSSKGKAIAQSNSDFLGGESSTASQHLSTSAPHYSHRAQLSPADAAQHSPYRPSHLRNLSNASSTSSLVGGSHSPWDMSPNASGINIPGRNGGDSQEGMTSGTPPGGGAGIESMFNFGSLAAMIDGEDKNDGEGEHEEHADGSGGGKSASKDKEHEAASAEQRKRETGSV